ncbi:MAG: OmpA family protein [Spirochaetota bacterium]
MEKTNHKLSILAVLLFLVLSLGYCKTTQTDETPTDTDTATEETTDTDTETTERTTEPVDGSEKETPDGSEKETPDGSEKETPDGSEKESESGKFPRGSEAETAFVSKVNEEMKDWRYPDGDKVNGFAYKSINVPSRSHYTKWMGAKKLVIQSVMDKLQDGYKLEITGHADASGPDEPQPDLGKKGNVYYSKERAESMKQVLVRDGFPEERIIVKGVGSQELLSGVDSRSPKNRRVTFQIVSEE